jgi:NADH:ubiquinone oxidoreductase subunit 6 (subunit J)
MSTAVATTLVNWSELGRIVLAALIGGFGVVFVFGLLLLGISRGQSATRRTARYGLYAFTALCGAFVIAVAAVGVYAMTQKPSSPRAKARAAVHRIVPSNAMPDRAETQA